MYFSGQTEYDCGLIEPLTLKVEYGLLESEYELP